MCQLALPRLAGALGLVVFGFAADLKAASAVFSPVADATISEKNLSSPMGSEQTLEVGTTGPAAGYKDSRALLRFNLAGSIPTNATVTSAALTVTLVQTAPAVTNLWLDLRKVLRPWSESAVTWTNRLTPPAAWSAPGGAPGVDFGSDVTQSNRITTTLGAYTFASNARLVADVQDWVSNPSNNWGWIMISELEGVGQTEIKFSSREGAAAPSLAVQYTIPAAPPTLAVLPPVSGQFRFRFDVESNRNYAVEYSGILPASQWAVLTNITALPASTNVIISDPLSATNRYYRVRTP